MFKKRAYKRRIRQLTYLMPRTGWVYRICKMYVDNYRGQNNYDMIINGELLFLRTVIPATTSKVIFDVGANHGQWAEAILELSPTSCIHCFEPTRSAFERLVSKDFPANVSLNQIGLGDKSSTMNMNIYGESSEINSVYKSATLTPIRIEEVDITTVVEYCKENNVRDIYFLKIDVEGHDFAVLKGAYELLLSEKISIVQLEYGSNWITARKYLKDLFEFVDSLPYTVYRIMPFGLMKISSYHPAADNFEHANYLLIHSAFQIPNKLKIIEG